MLYPTNMNQHGAARSIEEYLSWLNDELDEAEPASARAYDLRARIRVLEDEIAARMS